MTSDGERLKIRTSGLFWREVDGEVIILDGRTSEYLRLNGSARLLWRLLADGVSEPGLVAQLRTAYAVEQSVGARDVSQFLEDLRERQMLEAE